MPSSPPERDFVRVQCALIYWGDSIRFLRRLEINDRDGQNAMVRVHCNKTVSSDKAFKERGLFGFQHTVARPKTDQWRHPIERLKTLFGIKD